MNVLAIDPGTSTGWARHILGKSVEAGREEWKQGKGEQPGIRLANFRMWLISKISKMHSDMAPDPIVDLVAVEAPIGMQQKGLHANRSALAWNTVAEECAAWYGIQYVEVHASTIKKFATGSGSASKDLVLAQAIQKWPHFFPIWIRELRMTGVRREGKKTIETWTPTPDPKLFEISDALWILEWARKEVVLTYA